MMDLFIKDTVWQFEHLFYEYFHEKTSLRATLCTNLLLLDQWFSPQRYVIWLYGCTAVTVSSFSHAVLVRPLVAVTRQSIPDWEDISFPSLVCFLLLLFFCFFYFGCLASYEWQICILTEECKIVSNRKAVWYNQKHDRTVTLDIFTYTHTLSFF